MRINHIRPKKLRSGQEIAYSKDVDFYLKEMDSFIDRSCPAGCETLKKDKFAVHRGFAFSQCLACKCVFMDPAPPSELVEEFYKQSSNYAYWGDAIYRHSEEERQKRIISTRLEHVLTGILRHGRTIKELENGRRIKLLEFGSGTGGLARKLSDYQLRGKPVFEVHAVEPNPSMWPFYSDNRIKLIKEFLDLEYAERNDMQQSFDVVIAYEVLEHTLDPRAFLKLISVTLENDGLFFFSTPNSLSTEIGILKSKSPTIDIEHISLLSPISIQKMCNTTNFKIVEYSTPGNLDTEIILEGILGSRKTDLLFRTPFINQWIGRLQEIIAQTQASSHSKYLLQKTSG